MFVFSLWVQVSSTCMKYNNLKFMSNCTSNNVQLLHSLFTENHLEISKQGETDLYAVLSWAELLRDGKHIWSNPHLLETFPTAREVSSKLYLLLYNKLFHFSLLKLFWFLYLFILLFSYPCILLDILVFGCWVTLLISLDKLSFQIHDLHLLRNISVFYRCHGCISLVVVLLLAFYFVVYLEHSWCAFWV